MRRRESATRPRAACAAAFAILLAVSSEAGATLLVADFNDLSTGNVSGKAGGTGFTGNWTGSSVASVAANDLASGLYSITQSGTAQHYRSINATGLRQNYRTPTVSPSGTVWFSFLAMAEASGDQAGLSLNAPTASPFSDPGTVYAYLVGTTLNYSFGTGTAGTISNVGTIGSPSLIVGKMTIVGSGGVDSIQLWANPDLIANPDINAYTPVYSNSSVNFIDSISVVGAVAARALSASSGGGNVDNIRISDGGGNVNQGYVDVTGVPEPGTLAGLGVLAGVGLLRRSRRRA